jgi:hypothetical protein
MSALVILRSGDNEVAQDIVGNAPLSISLMQEQ